MKLIRKLFAVLLFGLCGVILYVAHPLYLPYFGEFLIRTDPLRKADAIIVLAGDDKTGHRVSQAVSLWRDGWSDMLVLSGGLIAHGVRAEEVMQKQAEEMGVPRDKISLVAGNWPLAGGTLADSTLTEAWNLLRECQRRKYRRVIVVTSNYHSRRARRIFRRIFGDAGIDVVVSASPDDSFDLDHWWTRRADARMWFLEMQKVGFNYFEIH